MGYNGGTMTRAGIALLLLLAPLAYAEDAPAGKPSVFIDTEPMGARIQLDGQLLTASTPALLRDLPPGKHTVTLTKDGFKPLNRDFEAGDPVPLIQVDLSPDSVLLAFPSNGTLSAPGGDFDTASHQFRVASGTYSLRDDNGKAVLEPVFPEQGALDFAGWSLALVSISAGASLTSDVWHMTQRWTDHPSLVTAALGFTALMELPWFLSINGAKDRFDKTKIPAATALPSPLVAAETVFQEGENELKSGNLDKAVETFGRFVRDFPESRLAPGAWYRLARIHSVTGRRELALGEYRLVAETYPQAAYHDRARQAMADLFEAAGNPQEALRQLDLMVFNDGFFSKDDVEAQKTRLRGQEAAPAN
jgi:outer membrane protein assembly factor BamD (BamD/ComL family)